MGNPPYVRLEDVPDERMAAYRDACSTMGGRADLYIGFYETALRSLTPHGHLGFICADRWMRNQYGRQLRRMVTSHFSMDLTLAMHDVDAVAAYWGAKQMQQATHAGPRPAVTSRPSPSPRPNVRGCSAAPG